MILLLIVFDQLTKAYASTTKPSFSIIGDFLRIQYIENTGTIFGLFEGANYVFMVLAIILCIFISIYMKKNLERKSTKSKLLMLVLTGGIGNLIDRIFRGFVVDFISLKYVGVFNLSDSYIVIGVILLLIIEIKEWMREKELSNK